RTCLFTARGRGPRELVSFFVPRRRNEEAIDVQERLATNGRAFMIIGRGVEDVLLVGGGGEAASGDLSSDAEWAWVRRSRRDELPSEFVMLQGRSLRWRGRYLA